jgi:hypothetical protein
MRIKVAIIAGALISGNLPASANSPMGSNSYLSLAKYIELESSAIDNTSGSPPVTLYLGGVIESLDMANGILEEDSKPLFCLSQQGLSANRMRILLSSYIGHTRQIMSKSDFDFFQNTMNVGAVSLMALQENFPCR